MSPYEVVYFQKPTSIALYLPITSKDHEVDCMIRTKEVILHTFKDNLVMAQNLMKQQANQFLQTLFF